MSADQAIALRDLRFHWRVSQPVLDIPALDIARGEHVFLHGRSGSGKSTLLALLAGVLSPVAGRVQVMGEDVSALRAGQREALRAREIGMIFQMFNLLPFLSVRENILLGCRLSKSRHAQAAGAGQAADEADRLLDALGMSPARFARTPAGQLSVGQQQRVAAARALIGGPALVIADEPTSALDDDTGAAFLALLQAEARRHGTTVLLVSHDHRLGAGFDRDIALARLNRVALGAAA